MAEVLHHGLEDIEDLFSDESSFYGDDDLKEEYQSRAAAFDPKVFWDHRDNDLVYIAVRDGRGRSQRTSGKRKSSQASEVDTNTSNLESAMKRAKTEEPAENQSTRPIADTNSCSPLEEIRPYNTYEGEVYAKQLHESTDEFLARLPPSSTTPKSLNGHSWLWVCNPKSCERPTSSKTIEIFRDEANRCLESLLETRHGMEEENPDKPIGTITRLMKPYRDQLAKDLVRLAKRHGVVGGKWMIFCSEENVDEIWSKIARATWENKLGPASKVSVSASKDSSDSSTPDEDEVTSHQASNLHNQSNLTAAVSSFSTHAANDRNMDSDIDKGHLICIYTSDFSNESDVFGVLKGFQALGFGTVKDEKGDRKPIYYKCDAYTYLDIKSKNEYKLKASSYSSLDRPSGKT